MDQHKTGRVGLRVLAALLVVGLVGVAGVATAVARGDHLRQTGPEPLPAELSRTTVTLAEPPQFGRTSVDPGEARVAEANRGTRPSTDAATAECRGPDRPAGVALPDDLPLTANLTAEALTQACLDAYDDGDTPDPAAVLCVRGVTFPQAVVAVGWRCADAARDGEQLRPVSGADLARLDAMRAVEVALMADPAGCPTGDDTVAWARQILAEERLDPDILVHDEAHACPMSTRVDWQAGVVHVEPVPS
jgi:hypothetical protein